MGAAMKNKRVEYENVPYIWNGERWFDARTFLTPCKDTQRKLNDRLRTLLAEEDAREDDPYRLVQMASTARDALQYDRAEELCQRAIRMNPTDLAPYTVLSSVLRARGDSRHALKATEPFKHISSPALLTTRAAALCDLGRYKDAKRCVGRALAIAGSEEAFSVVRRIKKVCPELY